MRSAVLFALDGVGDFPSPFALKLEMEAAPNNARLAITGFLRRPRNLTLKPENRPMTPSQ